MQLKLIDLIEDSLNELEDNYPSIKYVESRLLNIFNDTFSKHNESFLGIKSRIKGKDSLKEKIIRNKFYNNCLNGVDVLNNLHDLIGLNIQCRFITDEEKLLNILKSIFEKKDVEFTKCIYDENIYMNLKQPQPQLQNNGFTIYRIDGYYMHSGKMFNFELQIKSLVHNFWAEIEHQVVYKNNQLVYGDKFMNKILASINDNLEIVDHQLQIVYEQILQQSEENVNIGMNEHGFKVFLARSINDLYNLKMKSSLGVSLNFKKCSGILSQYIYIKDFINVEYNQFRMVEYFEQFNLLKDQELDFTNSIKLEHNFNSSCSFLNTLGRYWEDVLNDDFEWHSFFVMLFAIEPGNNIQDFSVFLKVIKSLLVPKLWFEGKFSNFSYEHQSHIKERLLKTLAQEMVNYKKIDMIFEHKLINLHTEFRDSVDQMEESLKTFEMFEKYQDEMLVTLARKFRKHLIAK